MIILTSPRTFSGGEEFAYDMQSLKLATIVGQVTGGGANPGGRAALGEHFYMFIPDSRARNPITKTNWEGTGVQPDVPASSADALRVAMLKLGLKIKGRELADIPHESLFAPSVTPTPGSDRILGSLINDFQSGKAPYSHMTKELADQVHTDMPALMKQLQPLGRVKSLRYTGKDFLGGDTYSITLERGEVNGAVVIGRGHKIVDLDLPGFN